jgi:hypothetical protein
MAGNVLLDFGFAHGEQLAAQTDPLFQLTQLGQLQLGVQLRLSR